MLKLLKHGMMVLIIVVLLFQNCATAHKKKSLSDFQGDITRLKMDLKHNPQDATTLREIGFICFDVERYPDAIRFLTRSLKTEPDHPKALFYLSLALQYANKDKLALMFFEKYKNISSQSPYQQKMEGRYHLLQREIAHQEMIVKLNQKKGDKISKRSDNCIAIIPPSFKGGNKKFNLLGRGICEVIIHDFQLVNDLKVIDPVYLQILQEEFDLANSTFKEQTLQQYTHLLCAGKIVFGTYRINKNDELTLNLSYQDMIKKKSLFDNTKTDSLTNMFEIEKELVFALMEEIGCELTPLLRVKIEDNYTDNMEAFLLFCKGVIKEDEGKYEDALACFREAIALDPEFELAVNKVESATSICSVLKEKNLAPATWTEENYTQK